ncbi:MAG: hypothetical protein JWQ96_2155 [Segetibacter sp.]|nr:hypothetical protein [Segetibacter sp.]
MNSRLKQLATIWKIAILSLLFFGNQEVIGQDSVAAYFKGKENWNNVKAADSGVLQGKLISLNAGDGKTFYPYNKKRVRLVTAGNIIGYGGSMVGLYSAWYSGYPQTKFHFFNDNREWQQVDKVGHAYAAYVESYGSMEMWRWAGLNRKQRIWLGGMSGAAYQTVIEVLDGFSEGWGWSWGDFAANVAGSGMLVAQELAWNDQRIRFKFSFHKKDYGEPELNNRADKLYGASISERFLKDYNGQTYWLSANINSFMPESKLPKWLNVAVGYGADGMFGGEENIAKDKFGNITFDRRDIKRYRQFYLAPDIDLTKIRTNNKALKLALGVLNVFKFPLPSLEYNTTGKFKVNFVHF